MRQPTGIVLTKALILMASMGALLALSGCHFESPARQKLNNLLDEKPEQHSQPEERVSPLQNWLNKPNLFGFSMPQTVDVQETAQAYNLRVPLASPGDADSIQVNVLPNRIEVSGQTGSSKGNSSSSSSFFQSFTTSQPVLPGKMSKKVEKTGDQNILVITIPKDPKTAATTPSQAIPATPAPNIQMPEQDGSEPDSLDERPHQVI